MLERLCPRKISQRGRAAQVIEMAFDILLLAVQSQADGIRQFLPQLIPPVVSLASWDGGGSPLPRGAGVPSGGSGWLSALPGHRPAEPATSGAAASARAPDARAP
jgi:hypothetical protein